MTNLEHVPAAARAIAGLGTSAADSLAAVGAVTGALAASRRAAVATPCGHRDGCTNDATHQFPRDATPEEAEAHFVALEQNIRASNDGRPEVEYVHPRTDTVSIAEHRCDDPAHADPTYLEAKAREETTEPGDG
jgi:hypothetical protein